MIIYSIRSGSKCLQRERRLGKVQSESGRTQDSSIFTEISFARDYNGDEWDSDSWVAFVCE